MNDYPLVILTNLYTLPYFLHLEIDGEFENVFIATKAKLLLRDSFFEFGKVGSIPVFVKYVPGDHDTHFICMVKHAFVGRHQVDGVSIDINKDDYLVVH